MQVQFDAPDKVLAEELIADIFYDMGLQGVALAPLGETPVEDWAPGIVPPDDQGAVTGYIPDNNAATDMLATLNQRLADLDQAHHIKTRLTVKRLDEEDWAESWKAFFWPEKVGQRFVVKPTWRTYDSDPKDIIIELDPGMAFGTGTHPTTRMCLQLLETYVNKGNSMLDVGTGSGILMVAAHKLEAVPVWGIDNDEVAVTVAKENLQLNKVPPGQYQVLQGDLVHCVDQRFDLIVANILSNVIIKLLNDIPERLTPNGIFICSGITEENTSSVIQKMMVVGLAVIEKRFQEGWSALVGR